MNANKTKVVIKRKGNCKKVVRDDAKHWNSIQEAANELEVHISAVSYALRNGTKCKGHHFYYETQAYKYVPVVMRNLVAATEENATLKAKAEAWDAYQAELEAQRKAEEKRLAEEAKAKAKHDAEVAKQEAKVARLEAKHNRKAEVIVKAENALKKAKDEECNAWLELCIAIDELNELNANMTVDWEVM